MSRHKNDPCYGLTPFPDWNKFSRAGGQVAQFALTSAFSGGAFNLLSKIAPRGGFVLASKASGGWLARIHTLRVGAQGASYEALAIKEILRLEGHPWGQGIGRALRLLRPHLHLDFWAGAPHHLSLEPLAGLLLHLLDPSGSCDN